MKKNIFIIVLLLMISVCGICCFMCKDKDKSYSYSDIALSVMSGNKVLKINSDNSLTEIDSDSKEIKLVKVSKDKEKEYLQYNDFSNMLKTYSLINEYSE